MYHVREKKQRKSGKNNENLKNNNENLKKQKSSAEDADIRFSKKEIEDIDEIFESEAERLKALDFHKEMAKISQEERRLNFSSKEYPVFKKMATELAKDYDSRINRDELAEMLEALKPKMGLAQYKENGMDENQMAIDIV